MTEKPDESLEPKSESGEPTPPNRNTPSAEEASSLAPANPEDVAPNQATEEGLPEWEPLTPELVEDEAIRGDFVIRWAVVGLALLLGISQISETRTLVHLKSGQYLLEHGLLPATNDVFTYTAQNHKWVNYGWLFDIAMAGIYSIGGGIGLSLVQGLITCLAFGLLAHTVRPNIRTWWGSICAVLALLTCYLQFTIQPELITLLGLSFVLWSLVQSDEPGSSRRLWQVVPAIWLWAQCDQQAWLGWFLLILWTAGELLTRDASASGEKGLLVKVTLASLIVVGVHPFLWETWLAPLKLYLNDYPAMCQAFLPMPSVTDVGSYPIWQEFIWKNISHRTIAALFLAGATMVTMGLNLSQLRLSHLFAFIGFNAISAFATHELAAASFVNCVVCTLNAQNWYRRRFGQVYSIDWRELLFSRGGRAVTVMSFFALAWLILSGRLDGPGGKRTGVGFESQLSVAMNDYLNLGTRLVDDHPFNFSMSQGDLMIWGGQKPFIDNRAGLFYDSGSDNVLNTHKKVRVALRKKHETIEGSDEASVWQETFAKYQIRQACPRLNGPAVPDYISLFDLMTSSDFRLTQLNSSTGVFVRTDPKDETAVAYLRDHAFDPVELAFRTKPATDDDFIREFPKPATTYDNLFSLRRPSTPSGVQLAHHYLQMAYQLAGVKGTELSPAPVAAAILAIRNANDGLRDEPNCADGYRVMGMIYAFLGQVESKLMSQGGPPLPNKFRYYQAVAAMQQSLTLVPDDIGIIQQLLQQYEMFGRSDIKLELLRKLKNLMELKQGSGPLRDDQLQVRERMTEAINSLEESTNRINNMVSNFLTQGSDRLQVANGAYQAGGLLDAIKVLEDDAIFLTRNPMAKLALGRWLLEAGRVRDASEAFDTLESLATDKSFTAWKDSAALSASTIANYRRSIGLWNELSRATIETNVVPTLFTMPFVTLNPMWRPESYPIANVGATAQLLQGVRQESVAIQYQVAMTQLEAGAISDAAKTIRKALELNPASPFRPVFGFYLECLTGEKLEPKVDRPATEEFTDLEEPEQSEPAAKPEAGSDAKPQIKEEPKAEPKPDSKSEQKPESNPEPKTDAVPESK